MRKNEHRKLAEQTFLKDRGRITNKELARVLGVHPATVARWKKLDEWDLKLVQSVAEEPLPPEQDFYGVDLQHVGHLNDRISTYLQKKELLPAEIRELAEAKYHLMSCMEIINEQVRFHDVEQFEDEDDQDLDR
jgi:hypothetical protein